MRLHRGTVAAATATIMLTALASCSGEEADAPTTTEGSGPSSDDATEESAAAAPACDDVTAMDQLPANYEGCLDEDGSLVAAVYYDCEDGTQMYVLSEDPAIWTEGQAQNLITGDANAYSEAFDACHGL